MKYYVSLDGEEYEVELTREGVQLDGEAVTAEIATVPGSTLRHLRVGDRGFRFSAARVEDGWELRLEGRTLRARVRDERSHAIEELAGTTEGGVGRRELRAPMPGLVVRVEVEEGQEVEEGDGLVVMEAMKMENELSARGPGTVAEVRVEEGQTVDQNDVLVVLE